MVDVDGGLELSSAWEGFHALSAENRSSSSAKAFIEAYRSSGFLAIALWQISARAGVISGRSPSGIGQGVMHW